jgi:hypothetical protein
MRILDRGTSSIQDIMAVVIFNVVPQVIFNHKWNEVPINGCQIGTRRSILNAR